MREAVVSIASRAGGPPPTLTYEPHYGLKEKPFSLSSDPRFLYRSRTHTTVYDQLRAGIRRREGIVVLTGDIGTGKTTLCRSVLQDLGGTTFCAFVPDPFVSREDLLKMLLIDFGVVSPNDLKSGKFNGTSKAELSYLLNEFLKSLVPLRALAVLVVDEAQNLSLPLLEEIRILSDLEGPDKLLQVVLVGQLEFLLKLKDPQIRQFDQRVSVRCHLAPLDRHAVAEYVIHRLSVASGGMDRVNFTDDAIDVLFEATKGNPRLINLVCDKALHFGYLIRAFKIGPAILKQALDETGIARLTPMAPVLEPEPPVAPEQARVAVPVDAATEMEEAEFPDPEQARVRSGWRRNRTKTKHTRMWVAAGAMAAVALFFAFGRPASQGSLAAAPGASVEPAVPVGSALSVTAVPPTGLAPPAVPAPLAVPLPLAAPESSALPASAAASEARLASTAAQPAQSPGVKTAAPGASRVEAAAGGFAVGVALFSGPERASRLKQELEAAGYQVVIRPLNLSRGEMFAVRAGPYASAEAAEADAGRIRQMPGLSDALVLPPPTLQP